jgi:hypothetical protein
MIKVYYQGIKIEESECLKEALCIDSLERFISQIGHLVKSKESQEKQSSFKVLYIQ